MSPIHSGAPLHSITDQLKFLPSQVKAEIISHEVMRLAKIQTADSQLAFRALHDELSQSDELRQAIAHPELLPHIRDIDQIIDILEGRADADLVNQLNTQNVDQKSLREAAMSRVDHKRAQGDFDPSIARLVYIDSLPSLHGLVTSDHYFSAEHMHQPLTQELEEQDSLNTHILAESSHFPLAQLETKNHILTQIQEGSLNDSLLFYALLNPETDTLSLDTPDQNLNVIITNMQLPTEFPLTLSAESKIEIIHCAENKLAEIISEGHIDRQTGELAQNRTQRLTTGVLSGKIPAAAINRILDRVLPRFTEADPFDPGTIQFFMSLDLSLADEEKVNHINQKLTKDLNRGTYNNDPTALRLLSLEWNNASVNAAALKHV